MNASLPQPTEPTNAKTLQKGVQQQVGKKPAKAPAAPNYKPGQLPSVKKDQAGVKAPPQVKSPVLPKPPVPDLNKAPVGVASAKPAGVVATPASKLVVNKPPTIPQAPGRIPLTQAAGKLQAPPLRPPAGKPPAGQPAAGQTGDGQPPVANQPKPPLLATIGKDPKKLGLIALAVVFVLALVGLGISKLFGGGDKVANPTAGDNTAVQQPVKQTIVTYWGLWEPSAVLEEVISDFEKINPGIKVDYRVQSHKDYRERLQTAIASGNGPDAFRYHASWVPMLAGDLAVMPSSVMSASEFKESFYPVASEQLQIDGKIIGIPLMYDGLGLYYNQEVLETAGVEPPETWAELKQLANELTVPIEKKEREGGLQRGGLAIGNASNVEHYSDILGLLILQNGGDPSAPAVTEVKDALTFYTNFIKQDNIWDSSLPSSTIAFARGEAVMMLAPSWRAHEVMELNPDLKFGIAAVPQLSDEKVAWSSYWAEGINDKSKNKSEAWALLKYLSSAEVMKKLYSSQAQVRAFGEPYSRVDLAGELASDQYVGAILDDANYAVGLYMSSFTHDNGLNDQVNEYYQGAINAFLQGGDYEEALDTLERGVNQVLRQYQ